MYEPSSRDRTSLTATVWVVLHSAAVTAMVERAERAVIVAESTRARLRRATQPADAERIAALTKVHDDLVEVMTPMRRAIGQLTYLRLEPGVEEWLRETSDGVQRERRKIRKMLYTASQRSAHAGGEATGAAD